MMDKNNTQTLQQTVRFFETLLRASADGIVITDPAKNIIFVNDTFCKFFSSNRQDVIETNLFVWLGKLDPKATDIWKELESQINENGIARDVEFASKTREGMRYFSVNSSLLDKIDIEEPGLIISIWRDDTERKMAQEALRQAHDELEIRVKERTAQLQESERKYRKLFEYSNDIIVFVDKFGKLLAVNNKLQETLGFTPEEVIGKYFFNLGILGIKELPGIVKQFKKAVEAGMIKDNTGRFLNKIELKLRTKNGNLIFVETSTTILKKDGKIEGFLTNIRDITERKHAEVELKDAKNYLDTIIRSSYDGIIVIDEDGRFEYGNEAFFNMMGYSESEMLGRSFMKVIHPDYHDFILKRWDEVQRGDGRPYEVDIIRKDGEVRSLSVSHTNMELGGKRKYCVIAKDITQSRRVEEEARLNSEIFKNVSEGIYLLGMEDGLIKHTNSKFEQMFGYDPGEMIGMDVSILNAPTDKTLNETKLDIIGILRKTGEWHGEVRNIRKDGTTFWSYANVSVFDHPYYGRVIVNVHTDITEQKKAKKTLKESEERFRGIFEQSPVAIEIYDLAGKLFEANRECLDLFGIDNINEVKGFNLFDDPNVPMDARKRLSNLEAVKYEAIFDFELVKKEKLYNTKRSGQRYLDIVIMPMWKEENVPFGYLVHVRDITERKRAEIEREQFFKFFQISNDIMVIADPNGCFKKVNPACLQTLGYSETELLAKPFVDFVHPDDRRSTLDEMARQIRLGFSLNFENRYICKDGTLRWLSWRANYDKNDGITYATARDITQSKQAEDALRESEARLQGILDNSSTVVFLKDLEGRYITVNQSFEELFHVTRQNVAGKTDYDLFPPEIADRFRQHDSLALEKGGPFEIEEFVPQDDGLHVYISVKFPLFTTEGKPYAVCGIATDITQRKRSEAQMRESEERFRLAFNNAPIGMAIVGLDESIMQANTALCKILGYTEAELTSKTVPDITHPDDITKEKAFKQMAKDGILESFDLVKRYIHADGHSVLGDLSVSLVKDAQGKPLYYIGQLEDITERKRAEEELRKSEERFRKLVEAEPECVKLLTKENILVDMNPAGLRMIEADSCEQVVGRSVLGIIYPEYREPFVDLVKRVFNGESALLEFRITGLKGTKRWLETHAVPLRDDNGKINLLISVTRDTTEHKRAEEERIALVAREQAALAEAEAARKLDRMKSMFIASTSHELRTPLNSIIGFTSLVLDGTSGELNPDQKEQLMIVHSSGKHLLSLINDIIDLSMIEAGRLRIVVSEFNLRQVVDEAATNLKVSINEKNLELKVNVSDIKMRSDRTRILQCLINLLSNAIKYTEKGSVEITAKVIDDKVELSVTDTGIGIKTVDFPILFGPFVRLQSPLTIKTSGTGLGLYLVKKLARDFLRGDVKVESEFGKGSKFTLVVPVELEKKV